jgi:AcrR family transcriptional regulator
MPMTGKSGQARAILDAARAMLAERGWNAITVESICEATGLSGEAFSEHFGSTDDLLQRLVDEMVEAGLELAKLAIEDDRLSALEKLNELLAVIRGWKWGQAEILGATIRHHHMEENAPLMQAMLRARRVRVVPVVARILEQGVTEGTFDTPDPMAAAEMIIHMSNQLNETFSKMVLEMGDDPSHLEVLERQVRFLEDAIERLLGAPRGSLVMAQDGYIDALIRPLLGTK